MSSPSRILLSCAAAPAVMALMLAACDADTPAPVPDPAPQDEAQQTPEGDVEAGEMGEGFGADEPEARTEPVTTSDALDAQAIRFDGGTAVNRALPEDLTDYAIRVVLRHSAPSETGGEWDETYPPMPFLIGRVPARQIGWRLDINGVRADARDYVDATVIVRGEDPVVVLFDGEEAGTVDPGQGLRVLRVGMGHRERLWEGYILSLAVHDLTGTEGALSAAAVEARPVVYTLSRDHLQPR